ncbi:MAG: DUF397 domain-containing protein [Pseudonocardiaceae bacterium]
MPQFLDSPPSHCGQTGGISGDDHPASTGVVINHQLALKALTQASGWRKSSYSKGANDCVEITTEVPGWVGLRDSKLGTDSPALACTRPQWRALLAATHADEINA